MRDARNEDGHFAHYLYTNEVKNLKIHLIDSPNYTGFRGVGCDIFFSGIPYRNVAVNTPHVPRKKKLKEKEENNILKVYHTKFVTSIVVGQEGDRGYSHTLAEGMCQGRGYRF